MKNKRALMNKSLKQNKSKSVSKTLGSLALVMGLFLATALPVVAAEQAQYDVAAEQAQYDNVYINGYKLGFFEQLALENHINRDIEDGNYWFELDTGMWGPVGGNAIGHIDVPEDYRDYVKSKLSKPSRATKVEFSAAAEECTSDCLYW